MSLQIAVAEKVTQELLSNVLTLLPSVSAPLSAADVSTLISTALESYKGLVYAGNNDLGLCVDRLLNVCFLAGVKDIEALEAQYPTLRSSDPIVSELMDQMSGGIASQLTTPLFDLRHTLPKEVADLTTSILSKVPSVETLTQPALRRFSWGKLGTEHGRNTAMMFAKDRLSCFKRDVPQFYDSENILSAIPYGITKLVGGDVKIRPGLADALTAAVNNIEDVATRERLLPHLGAAVETILFPSVYRKWAVGVRMKLASNKISAAVVDATDEIDAVEDLLRLVTTSMLTNLGGDTSTSAGLILENVDVMFSNIQLLRAAMVYHKDHTLSGRVLLSPTVIQEQALSQFENVCTPEMITDYVSFMRLNDHVTIPSNGVSLETIYAMRDKTKKAVQEQAAKARDMAAAARAISLQDAVSYRLDVTNAAMLKQNLHGVSRRQHEHEHNKTRALSLLRQKPLEDVALEYLVAMRESSLTKTLFKSINTELHALVKREPTVTAAGIATATCTAITSTLIDQLVTRFASVKVAA